MTGRDPRAPSGHSLDRMYKRLTAKEYDDLSIPDVEAYRAWFTAATMSRVDFEQRVALVAAYYAHFEEHEDV